MTSFTEGTAGKVAIAAAPAKTAVAQPGNMAGSDLLPDQKAGQQDVEHGSAEIHGAGRQPDNRYLPQV